MAVLLSVTLVSVQLSGPVLLTATVGEATSEVTVVLATAEQPLAEVTVSEYVPAVLAVVVAVVAPLLQR